MPSKVATRWVQRLSATGPPFSTPIVAPSLNQNCQVSLLLAYRTQPAG
jgi:hypothetical protein